MPPDLGVYSLTLPGVMLRRGFWVYVWRIRVRSETLHYVGRTGDESSPHASAPYDRFGQHLGRNNKANALRRNLEARGLTLDQIDAYDFVFYGPVHDEASEFAAHKTFRDNVAALEKALADGLAKAGYTVLNRVHCSRPLDLAEWKKVRKAFATEFPNLSL